MTLDNLYENMGMMKESWKHGTATPTVSAVVAYDNPETGVLYMLVIHQAILIPRMKVNLTSPMSCETTMCL